MYVTAFNPTSSPVVVSEEGHSIGGGEWGTVDSLDEAYKASSDAKLVLEVDPPVERGTGDALALAAHDETARRNDRAAQLEGRDKPALVKIAKSSGLITDDDDLLRADLERRLVASDVDLPKAAAKKQTQQSEGA